MYKEFYKLNEMPFENTPDPRFLYYSGQHQEALARMLYVIRARKGAGMLTGIFGCGKTVLGQVIFAELSKEKYKVVFVSNPRLDDVDLLRFIAYQLGVVDLPTRKADTLIILNEVLTNNLRDGKETVIIIDEAHSIEQISIFEELRLLLNFQTQQRFLLTLLLFGQPELIQKIETNKQLGQRIGIKCHLESLNRTETAEYIAHRLNVAGADERIFFSDKAIDMIFEFSTGIPRRINQLCDMALLSGFIKKQQMIDEQIVMEEVKGL